MCWSLLFRHKGSPDCDMAFYSIHLVISRCLGGKSCWWTWLATTLNYNKHGLPWRNFSSLEDCYLLRCPHVLQITTVNNSSDRFNKRCSKCIFTQVRSFMKRTAGQSFNSAGDPAKRFPLPDSLWSATKVPHEEIDAYRNFFGCAPISLWTATE